MSIHMTLSPQSSVLDVSENGDDSSDFQMDDLGVSDEPRDSERSGDDDDVAAIDSAPVEVIAATSEKTTKKGKVKGKPRKKANGRPKRPLSGYNLFFKMERERIINDRQDKKVTWEDIAGFQFERGHVHTRRRHRKSHGKIGFRELARTIAEKWKNLNPECKVLFETRASLEKHRYLAAREDWKRGQSNTRDSSTTTTEDDINMLTESEQCIFDNYGFQGTTHSNANVFALSIGAGPGGMNARASSYCQGIPIQMKNDLSLASFAKSMAAKKQLHSPLRQDHIDAYSMAAHHQLDSQLRQDHLTRSLVTQNQLQIQNQQPVNFERKLQRAKAIMEQAHFQSELFQAEGMNGLVRTYDQQISVPNHYEVQSIVPPYAGGDYYDVAAQAYNLVQEVFPACGDDANDSATMMGSAHPSMREFHAANKSASMAAAPTHFVRFGGQQEQLYQPTRSPSNNMRQMQEQFHLQQHQLMQLQWQQQQQQAELVEVGLCMDAQDDPPSVEDPCWLF
jgi:hypothetical protein